MPGHQRRAGAGRADHRAGDRGGRVSIGGQTLFLRGAVREIFFDWLRSYRPDLVPRYERLYARGAYVPERERRAIERGCRGAAGRRRIARGSARRSAAAAPPPAATPPQAARCRAQPAGELF